MHVEAFHQNYPEAADGHLERIKKDESGGCATFVVTIQFNRPGSLVAVGCNDGRIEIWDFVTRRIAKIIVAHSHPVCSISWSRNSRQLLSASTDNTVSIWNIVTGDCERIFTFPCPVMKVQFNPRNPAEILVCPLRHPPVLTDVITGKPIILKQEEENDPSVVASYDRRGTHIYTGNSRGKVCIYDTKTLKVVNQFRSISTATNAAIKSIEFARRGESHWRKCCFSGDGEFVCAGSMKQHSIYIWERASGTLFKILHGQKGETLLDVVWHPLRPIIISVSNSITKEQISIWAQTQVVEFTTTRDSARILHRFPS
ncbi:Retinoblastoma-binding protein [Echinococcus granulosus]|uniref:Retinoblastoma-binding protein n=1 Tax=Echinococcus granulosus TaxID=6210 RepID=W6UT80_ECHGR|nr:Retinoblastoma-binding protein [Echinococcus granulosus]EUB64473.1 Retinoblastoma-binding protein [Echinococcus granulosus]